MQYSIVNYKTVRDKEDFRWDGEFLCFEPRKNTQYKYAQIGDVLKFAQYGISIDMNEEGQGYRIYRMNEISDMFCDLDIDKYANIEEKEMKKFVLKNNDVLFNRTNSQVFVGRTGIFKKFSNEPLIFASYLVRFRPNEEKVLPEYLTAFLNTKYGIQDVKRRARISINQSNVSSSELQKVEIPLLSISFQSKLKPLFNRAFQLILDSKSFYSQVEQLLLSELGLLDWKPKHELTFIKNFSDIQKAERFDAEYFQPKYEEIINTVKGYKGGYSELGDFVSSYSMGHPFSSDSYVEDGVYLIRINNIQKGNLELSNASKIPHEDVNLSKKDIVKENDILISMSGTIGNSCKIPSGVKAVVNQRIFKFTPRNYNPDVLPLIINSPVGVQQLIRIGTGGVQTNISGFDILKIKVPCLNEQVQKDIAENIKQSEKSKKLSKSLLEIAKRGVEMAIEKDEEEAEKWIEEKLKEIKIEI
ncbi:MAG: restriction endonuclease subunit S [Patescibacteria group bacterium]